MDNEMNVSENVSAEGAVATGGGETPHPSAEPTPSPRGEGLEESAEFVLDESLELTEEDADEGEVEINEDGEESDTGEDMSAVRTEESDEEYDFDAALEAALSEEDEENSEEKSDAADAANEEAKEKSEEGDESPAGEDTSSTASGPPSPQGEGKEGVKTTPQGEGRESAEVLELRQRLAEAEGRADKLELRAKDALSSLGIEAGDDVMGSLEQLGAEQSDKSLEEYREDLKKRDDAETEKRRAEAEKKARDRSDLLAKIEAKKKADIAAIHAAYPHAVKFKTVDELPSAQRFKDLRDAGASPLEAYAAVNAAGIAEAVGDRAHKADLAASKSHLRSVSGKSAGGGVKMSASDYRMAKNILGDDVSDAELARIYKKVTK